MDRNTPQKVVIVGGGAGGLALAVKLGKKFKRNEATELILVDQKPTHIWKPLLHEVATGSLDSNHDEISYAGVARKYGFKFVLARLNKIDVDNSTISVNPIFGALSDSTIEETRQIDYTQLVIAIGSISNDFETPGVKENVIFLDSLKQAQEFHEQFIAHLHAINFRKNGNDRLSVVIVGGGATGVELSADLHNVTRQLEDYGFEKFKREQLSITLLEAGPRLLAQLPERISASVTKELEKIGVEVRTNSMVTEVTSGSVHTSEGDHFASQLTVWAAGIRAPELLGQSGLSTDRIDRLIVRKTLNLEEYPNVFALGDCSHCPMDNGEVVPPRAQSAHQMAAIVYKNILNQQRGIPLKTFIYRDFGSLVSLSDYSTVGNLMGNLMRGTVFIEGWLARFMYKSLYRMHQVSIHGYWSTLLIMLGDKIHRVTRTQLKLH